MATVEECRQALESLTSRLSEMDAAHRADLVDRDVSCHIPDLGVTFMAKLGPNGAGPVTQVIGDKPRAQVRFIADSDDLMAFAADPGIFPRAWLTGRIKVQASFGDLIRMRKFF
ncbi:MAG TPA: hypothetical protein VGS19_10540 [Streptosporangiaceae bacterium]|nr:hypothetical protein [Streptosporangiaceae bacterium]